jgi:CTP:molybdopterin cytidylyltransferase MocA
MQTILAREAALGGVLCCVVDQVYLSQAVLDQFWQLTPTSQLVAARYDNGVLGVPAFFGEAYFGELAAVADGQGARSLLKRYTSRLAVVPFAKGDFDLDYPQDWADFLRQYRSERTTEEE